MNKYVDMMNLYDYSAASFDESALYGCSLAS